MNNEDYVSQNDKIYGRNPVIEALESGRTIDRLYIQEKLKPSRNWKNQKYSERARCPLSVYR